MLKKLKYKNIYYKCIYCNYTNNKNIINSLCPNYLLYNFDYLKNYYVYYHNYHLMYPVEIKSKYTDLLLCTPID